MKKITTDQLVALQAILNTDQLNVLRNAGLIDEVYVSPKEEVCMHMIEAQLTVKSISALIDVRPATYSTYTNNDTYRAKLWRRVLDKVNLTESEVAVLVKANSIMSRIHNIS